MTTTDLFRFYEQASPPICVDTRELCPGDLFFALKGLQVDGAAFLKEAFAKGASGAVVSQACDLEGASFPLLRVPDPLLALQQLAKKKMAHFQGQVVAVTGSVGKTTTKDLLVTLLSAKYRVSGTPGNSNSKIGLPLSLLNHLKNDAEVVVLEMGMSSAGEIAELVSIAPPDVAIVTAVALAHAVNFPSADPSEALEAIAAAKAEIFSHSKTRVAVIQREACRFKAMQTLAVERQISFGSLDQIGAESGFGGGEYAYCRQANSWDILHHGAVLATLPLPPLLGEHNLSNLLGALLAGLTMGLSWEEMAKQIKYCALPKKRLQVKSKNGITFLDDSYNATSVSCQAALDTFCEMTVCGLRIAVLADMAELGLLAAECHREVLMYALQKADVLILLGSAFHQAFQLVFHSVGQMDSGLSVNCFFAKSQNEVIELLRTLARPGDGVLLKGSNLANLATIFDNF